MKESQRILILGKEKRGPCLQARGQEWETEKGLPCALPLSTTESPGFLIEQGSLEGLGPQVTSSGRRWLPSDKDSLPTWASPGGSEADTAGSEVTTVRDGVSPGPDQGHLIRGPL